MKTGVILYVTGADGPENDLDVMQMARNLNIGADRLETVVSTSSCFDVMDAWWKLTAKGMKRIVCMFAEVTDGRHLRLTGRELRLCG
ncbi:MAG: hypothetical protein B5M56_04235 [Desulfococcus sp. 4484_241]|nr:MAG: hypothetical protein B5M56_04235 [Desulfococcus sp. 4484_241]